MKSNMFSIYTLALDENKYFVGITTNTKVCLEDEASVQDLQWLRIYKPIEVIEFITDCDAFDQDKYVLKYMDRYGIDNVRGGSFYEVEIYPEMYALIEHMICTAKGQCYGCGKHGHPIQQCDVYDTEQIEKIWNSFKNQCFECYGYGDTHSIEECPNKHETGIHLKENVGCSEDGQSGIIMTLYEKVRKRIGAMTSVVST